MIEEIKKEIWKIREKTFTKKDKEGHMCNEWVDCLSFNDDILPLIKILDKYKDKEIKLDDGSSKYAVVKVPVVQIKNKYKNAWNELKEDINADPYYKQRIQELEQKHNLDKE